MRTAIRQCKYYLIFSLLSTLKEKCWLMRSPSCLCVCPPYQLPNHLVDFYEIQYGGHAIEGDLDAKIFNAVAATIPKWRTFKLLRWM
jgi:hypothetical protein